MKELIYIPEEGVSGSMRDLCECVFTLSDGQASSPQPWAFLPRHLKGHEKETLWGGGGLQTGWKRPNVSHSWVCLNYKIVETP